MRGTRVIVRCGIVAAVCLAVGACGLFDTRNAVKPETPTQGCRPLTSSPTAAVIPNVEDFYGRPGAVTCYNSMLDAAFAFHPDPQDSSQALPQTPYIAWDDSVEAAVNSRIGSQQDSIRVDFQTEYAAAIISTDQEIRFYPYELRLSFTGSPDVVRYTGRADITFSRGVGGQWKITDWVDHRGTVSDSTWGLLRAAERP
jgi:hypothetical protein